MTQCTGVLQPVSATIAWTDDPVLGIVNEIYRCNEAIATSPPPLDDDSGWEWQDKHDELVDRMVETRATTILGVLSKLQHVRELSVHSCGGTIDKLLESALIDLRAMTGTSLPRIESPGFSAAFRRGGRT